MSLLLEYHKYKDRLNIQKKNGKTYIRCRIRKKYLVLKPEELVRQLFLEYIIEKKVYPLNLIQVEKGIYVNKILKRFDIVVYDHSIRPFMLVECKSHQVKLSQNTLDQVSLYNLSIQAPFLLVTNGITTLCTQLILEDKSYTFLDHLPVLKTNDKNIE